MRRVWFLGLALLWALAAPAIPTSAGVSAGTARAPVDNRVRSLLYVANFLTDSVSEFSLGVYGNVSPYRTIGGTRTRLRHPFGLARDAHENLYVVSSGYPQSVTIFAPHAGGNVAPICTIAGPRTGFVTPLWIALDDSGTIFVTDAGQTPGVAGGSIRVFAARSCGNVAPIRIITGPRTQLRSPGGITFDATDHIIVASSDGVDPATSAGLRFAHEANGDAAAQRFDGSDSGLSLPFGIASVPGSKAFWVTNPGNGSVVAYPRTSPADLEPLRIIAGPKTGLVPESVTGIALDTSLNVYVSNRFANPNLDMIAIFAAGAMGNTRPAAVISGSRTQLFGPGGILVAPQ